MRHLLSLGQAPPSRPERRLLVIELDRPGSRRIPYPAAVSTPLWVTAEVARAWLRAAEYRAMHRMFRCYGGTIMPQEFRRIVTGHDVEGKSIIVSDGPPAPIAEFWVTDSAPADNSNPIDAANRRRKLEPPPNGSKFRFFMVEPEDPSVPAGQREEMVARRF